MGNSSSNIDIENKLKTGTYTDILISYSSFGFNKLNYLLLIFKYNPNKDVLMYIIDKEKKLINIHRKDFILNYTQNIHIDNLDIYVCLNLCILANDDIFLEEMLYRLCTTSYNEHKKQLINYLFELNKNIDITRSFAFCFNNYQYSYCKELYINKNNNNFNNNFKEKNNVSLRSFFQKTKSIKTEEIETLIMTKLDMKNINKNIIKHTIHIELNSDLNYSDLIYKIIEKYFIENPKDKLFYTIIIDDKNNIKKYIITFYNNFLTF